MVWPTVIALLVWDTVLCKYQFLRCVIMVGEIVVLISFRITGNLLY